MKILVIRNDKIGDLILTLPSLEAIRKSYPDAHLSVLVQTYTQEILFHHPDVDEVIIDERKDFFELVKKIKNKKFDLAIVLYPSWRNALLCLLSRIPLRVGTGYKPVGILFNKKVYVHRTKIMRHETDYCLKLVESIGVKPQETKEVKIYIKDEDKKYGQRILEEYQLLNSKPIIGIHPGCGGSALNWTPTNYAKIIDEIALKYQVKVIITGTDRDKDLVNKILFNTKSQNFINLVGKTYSLGQLMGLLSFYHLLIAPSTGPLHLARAIGTKIIGLFPPLLAMSPLKWQPLGKGHQILLLPDIVCSYRRCRLKRCKFFNCMEQITPQVVLKAIRDIVK